MREITKLTISILYLIFLLSVMCVQGSNVTGTLFQLTSKVTTCADIYARLLTKPLSNPLLGSLSYSDTHLNYPHEFITLKTGNLEKEVHIRQREAVPATGSTLQLMPTGNLNSGCMKSIISALRAKWMKVLKIGFVCILP